MSYAQWEREVNEAYKKYLANSPYGRKRQQENIVEEKSVIKPENNESIFVRGAEAPLYWVVSYYALSIFFRPRLICVAPR